MGLLRVFQILSSALTLAYCKVVYENCFPRFILDYEYYFLGRNWIESLFVCLYKIDIQAMPCSLICSVLFQVWEISRLAVVEFCHICGRYKLGRFCIALLCVSIIYLSTDARLRNIRTAYSIYLDSWLVFKGKDHNAIFLSSVLKCGVCIENI